MVLRLGQRQRRAQAQGRRGSSLKQVALSRHWNPGLAPLWTLHTLSPFCPTFGKKCPHTCKAPLGETP